MSLRENEHVQKWIEPTLLQTGELKWDGDVKQRELSVDNGLPHWKEAVVSPQAAAGLWAVHMKSEVESQIQGSDI